MLEEDEIVKEEVVVEAVDDIHAELTKAMEDKPEEVAVVDEATVVETPQEPAIEAPQSYTAAVKEKWKDLPTEVQKELVKREKDIEKMFTAQDGELRMGKELKEVITPYMPIIQAEGGTPAGAVKDLLNTAYVLRTGTPEQKAHIIGQVIQQYGVDLNYMQQNQQYVDPTIQQLQQEIQNLKQLANPEVIQKQLQERLEHDKVLNEVTTFAANPANVHYEKVKPVMAALLGSGAAKDMSEAYEMACNADPSIRSTLNSTKVVDDQAKRMAEIAAKKKAASSIHGSSSTMPKSSTDPNNSIEDDLRAAFASYE